MDQALEIVHRQAFLEDESDREMERFRAAHGKVVHRAVDREPADVAAGKEDGAHHVRVGAEGEARSVGGEDGAVVERIEQLVVEFRQHDLLHQFLAQLAAAAVREGDLFVAGEGQGTASHQDVRVDVGRIGGHTVATSFFSH